MFRGSIFTWTGTGAAPPTTSHGITIFPGLTQYTGITKGGGITLIDGITAMLAIFTIGLLSVYTLL